MRHSLTQEPEKQDTTDVWFEFCVRCGLNVYTAPPHVQYLILNVMTFGNVSDFSDIMQVVSVMMRLDS